MALMMTRLDPLQREHPCPIPFSSRAGLPHAWDSVIQVNEDQGHRAGRGPELQFQPRLSSSGLLQPVGHATQVHSPSLELHGPSLGFSVLWASCNFSQGYQALFLRLLSSPNHMVVSPFWTVRKWNQDLINWSPHSVYLKS